MLHQQLYAMHRAAEGSFSVHIFSIMIMEMLRSIDTNTDAKAIGTKKLAPVVCEQRAVGLKCVQDSTPFAILMLESHGFVEEGNTTECWFSAMPCELNFCLLAVDGYNLLDVFFQNLV